MMVINDDGVSTFLSVRARLFRTACRVLGGGAAAEDIVQEVWIRWQSTDRSAVRDPAAFLTTTANRLAINMKQAAHSRRETHSGLGLPEPIETSSDQALRTEQWDALTLGVLVLLGRLSLAERVAYILREAFDYPYRDIADVLGVHEANARQVVSRARVHVTGRRGRSVSAKDQRQLLTALSTAVQAENAASLIELLRGESVRAGSRGRRPRLASRACAWP